MLFSQFHPQIGHLPGAARRAIIDIAFNQLPGPRRVLLNICKILILTPLFALLLQVHSWWVLLYIVAAVLLYPLIIHPLSLVFLTGYIGPAYEQWQASRASLDQENTDDSVS